MPTPLLVALAWTFALSVITFLTFARDKRAASRARRRTPERTLHLLELLGGWPGALGAIALLHHKSAKARFYLVTLLISAVHAVGWGVALWWWLLRG